MRRNDGGVFRCKSVSGRDAEKRKRLSRMKNALAEHLFQIENLRGVAITERVQSSNTTTIDAMLESVEEEKERVDELEKEVEAISLKAKR